MSRERLQFPMLNYNEGTLEQVAQRLCAHALAYEINRLEDDDRATGWESLYRDKALEVAGHMRRVAEQLYAQGGVGLEARVESELARMRGFPCTKCGHRHEGSRYSYRCFSCLCDERPRR